MVARLGVSTSTAVPFACIDDDGVEDVSRVVKKRAIRCALSRICGICGETLTRPIAFLGPRAEADDGHFAFPPLHVSCARESARARSAARGGHLGHAQIDGQWLLVTTGGFDLVRPSRRGDPVSFAPNSVIEAIEI